MSVERPRSSPTSKARGREGWGCGKSTLKPVRRGVCWPNLPSLKRQNENNSGRGVCVATLRQVSVGRSGKFLHVMESQPTCGRNVGAGNYLPAPPLGFGRTDVQAVRSARGSQGARWPPQRLHRGQSRTKQMRGPEPSVQGSLWRLLRDAIRGQRRTSHRIPWDWQVLSQIERDQQTRTVEGTHGPRLFPCVTLGERARPQDVLKTRCRNLSVPDP